MTVPIPTNLPLLIGRMDDEQAVVVERILNGQTDVQTNLLELSKFWKVKVWFDQPQNIQIQRRWVEQKDGTTALRRSRTETEHVFSKFFPHSYHGICYSASRKARSGWPCSFLNHVIRYEPVIPSEKSIKARDCFDTYDQFARRFNRRFITETEIRALWNGHSAQHGDKYKPSDFRQIGEQGKDVMKKFLSRFQSVEDTVGEHYIDRNDRKHLECWHTSSGRGGFGRDIHISHTLGTPYVHYASEYPGCGNGRYGLVVNPSTFLWLEDD